MRKTATVLDSGLLPSSLYDCINKLTVHNMRCDLTPLIVISGSKMADFLYKGFLGLIHTGVFYVLNDIGQIWLLETSYEKY
jgi:hypothetical protein